MVVRLAFVVSSPSSRGPGRWPFKPATGVRIPLGTPCSPFGRAGGPKGIRCFGVVPSGRRLRRANPEGPSRPRASGRPEGDSVLRRRPFGPSPPTGESRRTLETSGERVARRGFGASASSLRAVASDGRIPKDPRDLGRAGGPKGIRRYGVIPSGRRIRRANPGAPSRPRASGQPEGDSALRRRPFGPSPPTGESRRTLETSGERAARRGFGASASSLRAVASDGRIPQDPRDLGRVGDPKGIRCFGVVPSGRRLRRCVMDCGPHLVRRTRSVYDREGRDE